MTNGILFYAYNNESVNYAEIANINAMLIKKHMKHNSISVITDDATVSELEHSLFDNIIIKSPKGSTKRTFIYSDHKETVTWKNTTRDTAYELSPYDTTLLLDVDYLIFNKYYDTIFKILKDSRVNFTCSDTAFDLCRNEFLEQNVGKIPMLWATVIGFTKTPQAEQYFSYMEYIKNNYNYFAKLYGFNARNFRNDYTLTIACKELYTWTDKLMFALPFLDTFTLDADVIAFHNNHWTYRRPSKHFEFVVGHTDTSNIHIMNKHVILKYGTQLKDYARA